MIQKAIVKAYKQLQERSWDKIYWAIDLHDTCIKSNYKSGEYEWVNEDVVECLKYIQSLKESKIIIWSSAYPSEMHSVSEFFDESGIIPNFFNQNPYVKNTETGCFNDKFYFSILIDDKAGFDPDTDWKVVLETLKEINNDSKI